MKKRKKMQTSKLNILIKSLIKPRENELPHWRSSKKNFHQQQNQIIQTAT